MIARLRRQGSRLPLLVLTARGRWQDKVQGLEARADDYLTKPFQPEELLARLKALLRRAAGSARETFEFGPLRLDPGAQHVALHGTPVELTSYEHRLLEHLVRHRARMLTKDEHAHRPPLPARRGARQQRHRGADRPPAAQARPRRQPAAAADPAPPLPLRAQVERPLSALAKVQRTRQLGLAVLQRGVRADQATPGHGIGLAVVRDIVDALGGELSIGRSAALGGARITLRLPGAWLAPGPG